MFSAGFVTLEKGKAEPFPDGIRELKAKTLAAAIAEARTLPRPQGANKLKIYKEGSMVHTEMIGT